MFPWLNFWKIDNWIGYGCHLGLKKLKDSKFFDENYDNIFVEIRIYIHRPTKLSGDYSERKLLVLLIIFFQLPP